MPILDRLAPMALVTSIVCLAPATSHAQVSVVVKQGDTPPGAAGIAISTVDNPFVNGLGQVGFVGALANGDHFVWVDQDVVWMGVNETTATLTLPSSQRYNMGLSDTGTWMYWPDVNGSDSIWTSTNGLFVTYGDPAPDYTNGEAVQALYRPTMLPTGEMFWIANIDTDGDSGTEARALFVTPDGTLANTTRLLSTGDVFNGITLDIYGVDYDYAVSPNGAHFAAVVDLATGETLTDGGVVVDGMLIAQESVTPSGTGDFLDLFDLLAINNAGDFLLSGDTDGDYMLDEFIVYNGTIAIREGDTVDGVTLASSSYVDGLAINSHGAAAHAWQVGSIDTLFYATDAANLAGSSRVVLREGDLVDVDGDGIGDHAITDFNSSNVSGGGVALTDSGVIFLEVDLDTTGNGFGDTEAMLMVIPALCGDGVVSGTELCDDGAETANCNADCTFPYCGDGVTNMAAGEGCDAGGVETADCDADCTLPECGDGVWNVPAGEVCDTGQESVDCDIDCTAPECGDGVVNMSAGEDCDDGLMNTPTCDADCTVPMCGDGVWNMEAGEICDDGAESVTCDSDCTPPMCGDMVVNQAAGEDCDDGAINTDSCDQDCTVATCGDGYANLVAGEECDEGGEAINCDIDCTRVSCGDGVVNASVGEDCDEGGETDTCNNNCTAPRCGDTIINEAAGETCDDGNTRSNDGCSDICVTESGGNKDGCSCQTGRGDAPAPFGYLAAMLLFGLALLSLRRRRRE